MQINALCNRLLKGRFRLSTKTLLAMKLTIFLLTAAFLQVSANSNAQTISFSGTNVPLEKVFSIIEQQTGYVVFYKYEWLKDARTVTISVRDQRLPEFLDELLKDEPLKYSMEDRTIVITRKQAAPAQTEDPTLLVPIDIHGRITDSLGNPLVGANITVKNSRKGTETDGNGMFSLNDVNDHATLVISFTGFISKEYNLNGNAAITISLRRSNSPLDEVQVIAYGTVTKRLNTGNVSTVTSREIGEQPVEDPLAALEGRVPGLIITQSTGLPGGIFSVQIRGQNSLINGNDPLYIVDGVPFGFANADVQLNGGANGNQSPFRTINPADIESIDVLKDADATAIYGSRGANGVILITTKKGKAGKLKLDLNLNTGFGNVTRAVQMMNTQQYLAMRHEAFANDNAVPDPTYDYDLLLWDTTRYTNWQKTLTGGTARYDDEQMTVSGGSAQTQFMLGGGYHRETTVMPTTIGNSRTSIRLNINSASLDKKFTVSATAIYSNDENKLPVSDLSGFANLPPDAPHPFDASGKLVWSENGGSFDNPYSYLLKKFDGNTKNLISNVVMGYQLLPSLQLKLNMGYTETHVLQSDLFPKSAQDPEYNPINSASYAEFSYSSWVLEPQLNYHLLLGKAKIDVLVGSTFQQDVNQGSDISASNFSSDALLSNAGAANNVYVSNSYNLYRYDALFARITGNWSDKYILNLTARRDGSSRFGPGKQFADFGAIGAAWIFSKENAMKAIPTLSFGKLRFSYGTTGNDRIGNYNYLSTYSPDYGTYNGISGLSPTRLYNPDYAWEANRKIEGGLELGFFKDRLIATASYFNNRSSNQLLNYALPSQTGFSSVLENFPAIIQNKGWEFTLTATPVKTKDFTWTITGNVTAAANKLVSFPGLDSSSYAYTYVVGQPLSLIRVFHYLGVDPSTGLYSFKGTTWPTDLTDYKDIVVKFYGGLGNHFSWRQFQLDVFFQFVDQNGKNYISTAGNNPGTPYNQPTDVLKRWTKPGDKTDIQRFSQDYDGFISYVHYAYYSGGPVADASFIRLKNASLSYSLPASYNHKIKASLTRIYLQGQNLLTITKYKGADPENQTLYSTPPLRVITAGLQITF